MSYKTLKVSTETSPDLVRALWMADQLNRREGLAPREAIPSQHEALGRILREWSSMVVAMVSGEPDFDTLCRADWQCGCGSSGLGKGGLMVVAGQVWCEPCARKATGG